jgi:predicted nucleotidyltransferase
MRLTEHEREIIVASIQKRFGPSASVYLFGSRTNDEKRGGDIDLFVRTDLPAGEAQSAKFRAISDIQIALGDQKIDMVLSSFVNEGQLILNEIEREAIPLG